MLTKQTFLQAIKGKYSTSKQMRIATIPQLKSSVVKDFAKQLTQWGLSSAPCADLYKSNLIFNFFFFLNMTGMWVWTKSVVCMSHQLNVFTEGSSMPKKSVQCESHKMSVYSHLVVWLKLLWLLKRFSWLSLTTIMHILTFPIYILIHAPFVGQLKLWVSLFTV